MKYIWTVEGDDPDYGQGEKYGIDGYFFPSRDAVVGTPAEVTKASQQPGVKAIGIYLGHNWYPGYSPAQLAAVANLDYIRVTKNGMVNRGLKVMFNMEQADPDYIAATLEAWRKLRTTVGTSWSPAAHQGGWMSPAFVARILASIISCFYDAAHLGYGWDGYAFTMGRLPWIA